MRIIIDIPKNKYKFLQEMEAKNGTDYMNSLEKGVVNGFVMDNATNGDMIKAMFPSVDVKEKNNCYEVYFGIGTATQYFNYQWWNAPYKAELVESQESEKINCKSTKCENCTNHNYCDFEPQESEG